MSFLLGGSREQAEAYRYNAQIQERNAKVFDQEAEWAGIYGGIQKQDFLDDTEKFNAMVGAITRKNGWTNTGTALDVQMESIDEQEQQLTNMDTQIIAQQRGIREKAINARMDSELQNIYARQAIKAGQARAFGTIVGYGFKTASLLGP